MSIPTVVAAKTALYNYTMDRERQRDWHISRCAGCQYCEGGRMDEEADDENSISEAAIIMMCMVVLDKGWAKTLERMEHIGLTDGQITVMCQVTDRLIGHMVMPDSFYN